MKFLLLLLAIFALGCARDRFEKIELKPVQFICGECGWEKTEWVDDPEFVKIFPCRDCMSDRWRVKEGLTKTVMPKASEDEDVMPLIQE